MKSRGNARQGARRTTAGRGNPRAALAGSIPEALRHDPNPGPLRALLHALYDLAWWCALLICSPWLLLRCWRDRGFRALVRERLGGGLATIPAPDRARVLVHGVSVGEVKAAQPLVRGIEQRFPGLEVIVSASTNTGLEVARGLFEENRIVRFPADPSPIVARFLRRVDPAVVLLVELEVWPNFLRQCNRRGIPVAVVNGRITELSHAQYLFFREILPQFNRISLFCVQLEEYAQRFRRLGVQPERIQVSGNVKFDGLRIGRVDPGGELSRLLGGDGRPVIVAGSTHDPEERWLAEAWRAHVPQSRLVIVPRHPHRSTTIATSLAEAGFEVECLSQLRSQGRAGDPEKLVLVDTIGELERIYGLADLAFVGGSLADYGGHNMLEPAAQGTAVVFGPHVANFRQEAGLLEGAGGCLRLTDPSTLGPDLAALLADAPRRRAMGERAMEVVRAQRGATEKTLEVLEAMALGQLTGVGASARALS